MKRLLTVIILILLLVPFLFLTGCTNPSTPAGHEGYVKENPRIWGKGGFRGALKGPENHGVSLWRNEVENVDFRPQTYAESFKILAKDELNITFRFQTIIKVKTGTVKTVVEEFAGSKFYTRYIKEPLRAMVRKNVQTLQSREVKEKRTEIAEAVMAELNIYLKDTPFIPISGVVGNIDYPKVVRYADLFLASRHHEGFTI